jgi:predicted CopG family antitoxin
MAIKNKNLSLDEETIKKGNELVKLKQGVKSFSHLVEMYILKDHDKIVKGK